MCAAPPSSNGRRGAGGSSSRKPGSTAPLRAMARGAGLSAASSAVKRSSAAASARSVLVRTMRSASATCCRASGICSMLPMPATASTTATSAWRWNSRPRARSVAKVCNTGPGSAKPEVSMTTRSKLGTAPRARSANRARRVSCRSVRTVQHKQPLPSSTVTSLLDRNSAWSMPISPNSLTTIAVLAPSARARRARIKVVLPAPRKPVTAIDRQARAAGAALAPPKRRRALPGEQRLRQYSRRSNSSSCSGMAAGDRDTPATAAAEDAHSEAAAAGRCRARLGEVPVHRLNA